MARTRSPDYDSIQEHILDKTAELFASRGFVASSIGDIAEACECSKSRLYHYFDSKEAILITMLNAHVDRLIDGAKEIVAAEADPVVRFHEITRFFMEIYAVSRAKHVVLLTCMEFLPEASRTEIFDKQRALVSHVRIILAALKPGESRTVRFEIGDAELKFVNADLKEVVEAGRFDVQLGLDSQDVLVQSFELV